MSLHRLIAVFLITWLPAIAQEPPGLPPGVPPGVPVPGEAPAAASAPEAAAPAAKPVAVLGDTKIIEDIIEPKLSGNALAGLYRKYTGRRVIVSTAASTAEFSFVQDASPEDPLTYAEAAELLRKAAVLENFVFVEHPQDPNLDVLTLATGGPRPTNVDISVFNENTPLPDTDVVITYVMTLNHIKPDQALNIFTQVIGQFGAYGSIAAVPNASAVVITEKASLIKSLIDLQKTIDVPGSVQSTRWIPVQYADVTEIATVLTELLTAQQSAQTTAGVQRTSPANAQAPPGLPPGVGTTPGAGGGEEVPVQIVPEPRTNRIFAMGRPVDLIFVENLVREFDIPSSEKTFLRRKLRFLTVSEFLPIAGDALTRAFSGTGEGGAAGGGTTGGGARSQGTGNNRATQQSSGFGRDSSSGMGGSTNFGGSMSSGGSSRRSGGGGSGGGSSLGDPSISSAPESLLVGRTLLVADNITNSVVAQGPPSALEIIERLLDQIDVKPDQVMISTVIGQLSLNNNKEFGVGYLFNSGDFRGGGGGGLPAYKPVDSSGNPINNNDFPLLDLKQIASSGLRLYGTTGDLSVFVKAIQSKSDFTVLSRPSIFTSNNQKGTISSGERIAIPTEGGTSTGSFSSGTRIEYQDVVLKLEVIPLVNSNNEITMQIALLNDEQSGTQTISGAGTDGGDLTVPRITTREILTTATVPNGQTIVLGGLIVGKNDQTKSGIPILSDIPYLGRLFSSTSKNDDRSELMVFIQPSIVNSDRTLDDVQSDMDARYKVSPDARTFADGPGVLPEVDEIPEVREKGASRNSSPPPPDGTTHSTVRPSLRPAHRR
jgi:general secretion pathway protein D